MQFLLLLNRYFYVILSITVLMGAKVNAQEARFIRNIVWEEEKNVVKQEITYPTFVSFKNCKFDESLGFLPFYNEAIRLPGNYSVTKVQVRKITEIQLGTNSSIQSQNLFNVSLVDEVKFFTGLENGKTVVSLAFLPLQLAQGKVLGVKDFEIVISYTPSAQTTASFLAKKAFANNSVLAQGTWYKLAVTKTGFQKLDRNFLNSIGVNPAGIDPRNIKVYGNGAGVLPQPNAAPRPDDLVENAIWVSGELDGVFDASDYVLFYGKAQADVWKQTGNDIRREKNVYADTTYYFLTISAGNGKRIVKQSSQPTVVNLQNTHIFCHAHEQDIVNVGRSGRQYLGEAFERNPSQNFSFYIDGFLPTESINMVSAVAARSYITPARFDLNANGIQVYVHANIPTVGTSYDSYYFANSGPASFSFSSQTPQVTINYLYNSPAGGATAWLDYFEINTNAQLTWYNAQVLYRVKAPTNVGATQYTITGAISSTRIFDVTAHADVTELMVNATANQATFINNTIAYTEFAGINASSSFWVPQLAGKIANQNLHALTTVDALYITPDIFYTEALRLAAYHQQKGITIHVVRVSDIYNEFSSGSQDLTAIRDFIRMIYLRGTSSSDRLKYVTFFGRASYDYKNRISNNTNFVPTYESLKSDNPIWSYCSDDYFGLLDEQEGKWETAGDVKEYLEIGIGRLPITTATEAAQAVDKIINYHKEDRMSDWRNKLVFVADDEDSGIHQSDANAMANSTSNRFKNYNIQKIWVDAYKQEVVAGGQRYPTAQKAISDAVQKGCFMVNYTGHGGELGWAAERILTIEDINSWTNETKLPLFVTATCEFSRFDDPGRISAGELCFLNNRGGAIALFTTVRLVLSSSNALLNNYLYNRIGLDSTSKMAPKTIGEIIKLAKNDYTDNNGNERNFTLLGDAVMTLAYPKYNVATTSINNRKLVDVTDTLKALSKVTITGVVQNASNQLVSNYSGEVFVTVYDKPTTYQTLSNDAGSGLPMPFDMQNNIIYSGSSSVVNGTFSCTFVVPKDISYQIGRGKISYYATDNVVDANGSNFNFMVGGTADSVALDNIGPEVKLFMDDYKFVYGGLTNENPLFIAKLFDENGINTIGRGIGRELMLVIDGDNTKSIPVNDYYKAQSNSYQQGEVRYPLKNLVAGKHTATLKAWDTYNNSSEINTEFIVATSENLALQQVLNYPNPFSTNTTFHFDHNKVGENLTVSLQVFTISGKLAKTLMYQTIASQSHFDQLTWNGTDDYGDKLANGVYIYKIKVRSDSGKIAEATQKLVILN